MKTSLVKWFPIVALCLALLGLPALLGACDMGTPAPLGTSSRNPYIVSVTHDTCTAWRITLDGVPGKPWCASTVPSIHVGDYVQLLYGVAYQDFKVTSIDAVQHHISFGHM